jgi:hypothetical protein
MAEADRPVAHSDPTYTDTVTAVRRLVAANPELGAIEQLIPYTDEKGVVFWKALVEPLKGLRFRVPAQAALEWKKHEAGIEELYKAFCNSELVTFVQLADGTWLQLVAWGWQEAAFWREMILGGKVRASAGEQFEPYAGRPVFIKAFQSWLDRRTQSEPPEPPQPATNEVITSVPPVEENVEPIAATTSAPPSDDVADVGSAETVAELRKASGADIRRVIRAVYAEAKKINAKPPNINELPGKVQPKLRALSYKAAGHNIKIIGGEQEFERQRQPSGKRWRGNR